jgi:NAD(P)-dependent dehydrogenase (short-subunit alcohol dehydrogenase family)
MEQVTDRVVLIAGTGDAVGEAISIRLARLGAKLAICDVESGKVDALVAGIRESGGVASGFNVNLSDPSSVKTAVDGVLGKFGAIHVLVNNPGAPAGRPLAETSIDDFMQAIGASLNPQFFFLREVVPTMRRNGGGRIVNISSIEYLGFPGKVNLSAPRSAVLGLTRSIALEVAKDDIMVNTVVKGDIADGDLSEEELERRVGSIPVKKLGTPADIARAVGFFVSDTSKYITGQTFFVCGGKSVHCSMSV